MWPDVPKYCTCYEYRCVCAYSMETNPTNTPTNQQTSKETKTVNPDNMDPETVETNKHYRINSSGVLRDQWAKLSAKTGADFSPGNIVKDHAGKLYVIAVNGVLIPIRDEAGYPTKSIEKITPSCPTGTVLSPVDFKVSEIR